MSPAMLLLAVASMQLATRTASAQSDAAEPGAPSRDVEVAAVGGGGATPAELPLSMRAALLAGPADDVLWLPRTAGGAWHVRGEVFPVSVDGVMGWEPVRELQLELFGGAPATLQQVEGGRGGGRGGLRVLGFFDG